MSGFEAKAIDFTRGLWELGRKAVEMKLGSHHFRTMQMTKVLEKLQESEDGSTLEPKFTTRFSLNMDGVRIVPMLMIHPTWIEKPEIGISRIKFLMAEEVFPFDANRERVNQAATGNGKGNHARQSP